MRFKVVPCKRCKKPAQGLLHGEAAPCGLLIQVFSGCLPSELLLGRFCLNGGINADHRGVGQPEADLTVLAKGDSDQPSPAVLVGVASEFDSTGYMQPTSITWADGRTFPIETVRDFRPAGTADNDCNGDCFTVLIQGQEKHLFFEHIDPRFTGRLGRWYVERAT